VEINMQAVPRLSIHHCASQPLVFFGREPELALLDAALDQRGPSLVAFVGPGGQGKTAILQHWLGRVAAGAAGSVEGVFFWSFYRGKDSDLCLRELYAAVSGQGVGEVSASWCVDRLLPLLRAGRWVVLLDGAEVVQHEAGPWFGRLLHPDLGCLLEELASEPQPGVTVVTTRFPLPDLERRPWFRGVSLGTLDLASARALLAGLGVRGSDAELDAAAAAAGRHAKAVELLATYLASFHGGDARRRDTLPDLGAPGDAPPPADDEERHVLRVLQAHQAALPRERQDILALATAFRDPPSETRLLEYLASAPARVLLHETWQRGYLPFVDRPTGWLAGQINDLVRLRLLERVGLAPPVQDTAPGEQVIDAHPLVRRGFEHVLGTAGRRQTAGARAGFLRGRPDRRRAATLDEAREEVELFHAYCDAGLWSEADLALAALEQPRYRFLAPAFERDLLLRFYPGGDRRRPPLWTGFARRRSLAVCLEMLGRFEEALDTYPPEDAPLRGDALLALGRLEPFLAEGRPPHPWEMLWQAYRAHALCLAGQVAEAVALSRRLVPRDVYEWTHVFECLLRAGELGALDMNSFLYRPPRVDTSRWDDLARRRMRADALRVTDAGADLGADYKALVEGYDQGGLPWERALARLGQARWLLARGEPDRAAAVNAVTLDLARRHAMGIIQADAAAIEADLGRMARRDLERLRAGAGCLGPSRP
jgi:hypothetical protein